MHQFDIRVKLNPDSAPYSQEKLAYLGRLLIEILEESSAITHDMEFEIIKNT